MTALLTHSKQFNDNLFLCHNFDNLPLDSLLSSLSSSKFVCIRGLLEPTKVKQSKLALSQKFSRAKDHPLENPLKMFRPTFKNWQLVVQEENTI